MSRTTDATAVADLATIAGLLQDLAFEHLSLATDHNGRPAVVVTTPIAEQIHVLVREIARRTRELQEADHDRH